MNLELLTIAVLVGLGTWAMRYLPTRLNLNAAAADGPLSRFLAAIGTSAITALFVAAILPGLEPTLLSFAPILLGCAAVVAVWYWRRDVSLATIAGAIVYGTVFAAAGGAG